MNLYVSNDANYDSSAVCPGGPYLTVGDFSKSYKKTYNKSNLMGDLWNYGAEVWCNKRGQYVTIEADLTSLSGSYEMTICQLGVFGTKYIRANSIAN